MSNPIDHRIFGFDEHGQLRANLYHGAGQYNAGVFYSWTWAPTSRQLAYKLERQWEQAVTPEEWEWIEELEAPRCPRCNSADVTIQMFDFGAERETGYSDSGRMLHCLDCGAREEYEPAAVAVPRKAAAQAKAALPGVAA